MAATIDTWNEWSAHWATLMAATLWQSTVLALLIAAIAFALRSGPPALRYWLWQIVAIKLLVMPLWSWGIVIDPSPAQWSPMNAIAASDETSDAEHQATPDGGAATAPGASDSYLANLWRRSSLNEVGWQGWLMASWAVVVFARIAQLSWQRYRLSQLLRACAPAGAELTSAVASLATHMQCSRSPKLLITALDCSPFVCGMFRPTLVLPRELVSAFSPGELRQVLAHELAHVKRRDLLWGWPCELAAILFFFHPVAHWARYRIRFERELACDQLAMVASEQGPAQYAETLVRVISSLSRPSIFRLSAVARLDGAAPIHPSISDFESSP